MNIAAPVQLSTLPTPAAAPQAAPDTPKDEAAPPAPPESGSDAASGAASTKKEPEHDVDLEVSRRLETISKREARARKYDAEHHERMTALSEKEKQIASKLEELDAALSDPVKYLLDKGKNPVEVARRFAEPETEEARRIRKLEERDAEREAKAKEEAAEWEAKQAEARKMSIVREFVGGINERDHPHLVTEFPDPNDIPPLVTKLLNRKLNPRDPESPTVLKAFVAKHHRNPTDAELRETLETEAEERATRIIESRARRTGAASQASQAPESSRQQPPVKAAGGTSGISNQHASVTSSGKSRARTLEEKRRQARKELTEALEAEASERT